MPPKKVARPAQENISLGPQVREGESESRGEPAASSFHYPPPRSTCANRGGGGGGREYPETKDGTLY